jgi:recyclin-1
MNLIDSNIDDFSIPETPKKSVELKRKNIPPDVLIRIFSYLPVPTLAEVAVVSRRFKVLVYDDEIWQDKLDIMLKNDSGALAAMLGKVSL